ncbi:MAG TPA: hypothetical protein VFJ16_00340 [Longimicrobium sp.]|nr:hypothetical protein [Longimicrobium sp.]
MRTAIALLVCALSVSSAAAQAGGIAPVRAHYAAVAEMPGGGRQDVGTRDIIVADSVIGGEHAWVVVNVLKVGGQAGADSVLMRAADLRPISRRASIGDVSITVDVRDSMLTGTLKSPQGTVPVSIRAGERAFLNFYALRTALRAWPLAAGWRGTASVLELNDRSELTPLELVVEGEEKVRVPAGEFDCWRVHVTGSGGIDERWWVSKIGGHLVRTREPIGRQGAVMQLDLVWLMITR